METRNITRKTLSNGMKVAMERLDHVQSAAIGVCFSAGAIDESLTAPGQAGGWEVTPGISHYIEHMMFKGTETRTAKGIAEEMDMTGGSVNAFTGQEATCYHAKTLSSHIGTAIEVLSDMLRHSVFDEAEMEKEKGVIIEEINMNEDNPEDLGQDLIMEAVFGGSTLGNRVIGTKESVRSITREDMLAYTGRLYTAGNSLISVAGSFDEDELTDMLESAFGGMKAGGPARRGGGCPGMPSHAFRKKDIEQSHIFAGRRCVRLMGDDYFAFQLYSSILGGSMSSRLFQSIREERGLAYSVFSTATSFKDDGLFFIYAGVGLGKEKEACAAIAEEMSRLARGGASPDELLKAKEQFKAHYIFGLESVSSRMFATCRNMLTLDREVTPEEVMKGVDDVTPEKIKELAEAFADTSGYSTAVISGDEIEAGSLLP